jgi:transposase-like protein
MATNQGRKILRYSVSFKQMVVNEIEQGGGLEYVRKKYDIGGYSTISRWLRELGRNHLLNKIVRIETMSEKDKLKKLEHENQKLKLALANAYMAKDCLEGVIKMANEEYKMDLKKNFGDQLPDSIKDSIK